MARPSAAAAISATRPASASCRSDQTHVAGPPTGTTDGSPCNRSAPGAVGSIEESDLYYLRIGDDWLPLCEDYGSSVKIARDILARKARVRTGTLDAIDEAERTPLAEHLDSWGRKLASDRNTPDYVRETVQRVRSVCDGLGWSRLSHLSGEEARDQIDAWTTSEATPLPELKLAAYAPGELAALLGISLQALGKRADSAGIAATKRGRARRYTLAQAGQLARCGRKGIGETTVNHYRKAVTMFGAWLADRKAVEANPFAGLTAIEVTEYRHQRTNLAPDEVARLLAAVSRSDRTRAGLCGADRGWLYRLAILTTLRSRTLSILTPSSITFGGPSPMVSIAKGSIETKRKGTRTLPRSIAEPLSAWLAGRPPHEPLWPGR